ncbi:hypothetical protein DPMN_179606 [Dreissena polymorpha]|uniref:Uncharacterized protein n=1 Tax=Dreissena polymorpha TaxID=45954 RepID=A0A9D4EF28_DREPO|nr:hypothetical protein DPMN_179606 [Dreissena polymorpha]
MLSTVYSGDEEAADDVQSEKQEEPELSGVTGNGAEAVWKPGTAVSEFRFMMDEKEFNIKLVELKQTVNSKVKTALLDRKSLKYDGPRMQPLPPPQPKPSYGGRGIRKEGVITTPGKQSSTNWRTFSMGIGLGGN